MIALALDILAAGIAVALYALGIRLFLGRCRRLARCHGLCRSPLTTTGPTMRPSPPAAEPLNVNSISIAVFFSALIPAAVVTLVACLRVNGWL